MQCVLELRTDPAQLLHTTVTTIIMQSTDLILCVCVCVSEREKQRETHGVLKVPSFTTTRYAVKRNAVWALLLLIVHNTYSLSYEVAVGVVLVLLGRIRLFFRPHSHHEDAFSNVAPKLTS
jgi:Ca2+/H+ antiporter